MDYRNLNSGDEWPANLHKICTRFSTSRMKLCWTSINYAKIESRIFNWRILQVHVATTTTVKFVIRRDARNRKCDQWNWKTWNLIFSGIYYSWRARATLGFISRLETLRVMHSLSTISHLISSRQKLCTKSEAFKRYLWWVLWGWPEISH